MTEYTVVMVEAGSIQDYVFGSNHLAQNIGASELVYRSTTEWLVGALDGVSSNIKRWTLETGLELNDARVTVNANTEVVYAGGGNAMLLFTADDQARKFIERLTMKVLQEARGLQLVAGRKAFTWDGQGDSNLRAVHKALRQELAGRKLNRPRSTPLLGLAVTAACVFTGLPAICYDNDPNCVGQEAYDKWKHTGAEPRLISAQVAAKICAEEQGKKRLGVLLKGQLKGSGLDIIYDFDQFGEKGESSYIAIVHADANQMGERFEYLANSAKDDRDYVARLQGLSHAVQDRARKAMQETVAYLMHSWDAIERTFGYGEKKVTVPQKKGKLYLPFRPIVFGGDDTTFVCDGRLGLPLAAKYLQSFTKQPLSDGKESQPIFARAGVAVVKTHFPFSRAYELADALIASAKNAIDELKIKGETSVSVIDWHFSTTGVIRELKEIREREYKGGNNLSVVARPIRAAGDFHDGQWRNWETFVGMVRFFQSNDAWAGRRNKLIAMRNALRERPGSFRLFRENYRIDVDELPEIKGQKAMQIEGWDGEKCGYFDAIEATDFFVSLDLSRDKGAV